MPKSFLFKFIAVILIGAMSFPLVAQTQYQQPMVYSTKTYPQSGERYITDEHGVIRMWINVLGWVKSPGSILVYDGIDIVTVLAQAGGYQTGANLKKIRIIREQPDEDGKLAYTLNLNQYLKNGNRDEFIKIYPNDTIIIPQTIPSFILSYSGTLTAIMNIIYYYTITKVALGK